MLVSSLPSNSSIVKARTPSFLISLEAIPSSPLGAELDAVTQRILTPHMRPEEARLLCTFGS